jgi:hypothetical protein
MQFPSIILLLSFYLHPHTHTDRDRDRDIDLEGLIICSKANAWNIFQPDRKPPEIKRKNKSKSD